VVDKCRGRVFVDDPLLKGSGATEVSVACWQATARLYEEAELSTPLAIGFVQLIDKQIGRAVE
jgi:hypothetical protein